MQEKRLLRCSVKVRASEAPPPTDQQGNGPSPEFDSNVNLGSEEKN